MSRWESSPQEELSQAFTASSQKGVTCCDLLQMVMQMYPLTIDLKIHPASRQDSAVAMPGRDENVRPGGGWPVATAPGGSLR